MLRVIRGNPSPEELAALVAVLATRGGSEPRPEPARPLWSRPVLRTSLAHGPGAWRTSSLPR